jgi:hypothetical protein
MEWGGSTASTRPGDVQRHLRRHRRTLRFDPKTSASSCPACLTGLGSVSRVSHPPDGLLPALPFRPCCLASTPKRDHEVHAGITLGVWEPSRAFPRNCSRNASRRPQPSCRWPPSAPPNECRPDGNDDADREPASSPSVWPRRLPKGTLDSRAYHRSPSCHPDRDRPPKQASQDRPRHR